MDTAEMRRVLREMDDRLQQARLNRLVDLLYAYPRLQTKFAELVAQEVRDGNIPQETTGA